MKRFQRIYEKLKFPLRNQRGGISGTVSIIFSLLVGCMLLYCSVDLYGYWSQRQKLVIGANELMEVMKAESGYSISNRRQFDNMLVTMGLDPSKVTISEATPKSVQRWDTLTLTVQMNYETIGLKPLGKSLNLPIHVSSDGLARTFIR
ncbi:DUF4320 family protein [Paenibacillus polymyxa]|uniref:DUF4320 family protein n=1 Tax=Paenibacillus polymyxa TaxID=1406 RepID=UPI002AB4E8A2|nr:DUF4320 family protein [Paenibacillus polymyxa]MDY7989823.1 DUF4320 family protein [Paenibacillus polymyxa]MDY8116818.1 DUF4320 family protein [Paenibacillus polymyxa]